MEHDPTAGVTDSYDLVDGSHMDKTLIEVAQVWYSKDVVPTGAKKA
jgi:hypothetical protein